MRFDNIGLFWKDEATEKGKKRVRPQPPIPETGWVRPRQFPNLTNCKSLAIDTETKDPQLKTHGAGWARGVGHMVGLSVCTEDNHKWYFPMRHEVNPEENMDPEHVLAWARDNITQADKTLIGANITYDLGWLQQEGVYCRGKSLDILFAEALLNDNRRTYNLDSIAEQYGCGSKDTGILYKWCDLFYGGGIKDQRKNIFRAPPSLVGPYAEQDALLPFNILKKQWRLLEMQGLLELFDLESRLIPLMVAMRFRGVRVDVEGAERARELLLDKEKEAQERLNIVSGCSVDVNSNNSLERVFKKHGLSYPLTAKGNSSFTAGFLQNNTSKIAKHILGVRHFQKARSTFIEGYILDKHIDGRVYGSFPQLKGDGGGTVSGRFASSLPNLQNIPSRDDFLGPLIRGLYIPDEGFGHWYRIDLSQIEYRFLAHFAVGEGANKVRTMYNASPDTDFHQAIVDLIYAITGIDLGRKPAKTINFGLCYGMGKPKLGKSLGLSVAKRDQLFDAYHEGAPFVKATFDEVMKIAQKTGLVKTIMGRRSRFENWESIQWDEEARKGKPLTYDQAFMLYGGAIQRAYTHKALNRKLQGSAADWMKKAMVDAWEGGVFNELNGVCQLTVHDELDGSYNMDYEIGMRHLKECMENAMELTIPVLADIEIGKDWGHCQKFQLAA